MVISTVAAAVYWVRSVPNTGILKVKEPREGAVVEVMGGGEGNWLEQFRRNSKCVGENGSEFCDELIDRYLGMELPPGKVLVEQHYAKECPYCTRQMPIFNQILNEFMSGDSNTRFVFRQNDVLKSVTPGIRVVPSIIKFDGVNIGKYNGPAAYEPLKEWILTSRGRPVSELRSKK